VPCLKGHTKIVRQTAVSGMVLRRRRLTVCPDPPMWAKARHNDVMLLSYQGHRRRRLAAENLPPVGTPFALRRFG